MINGTHVIIYTRGAAADRAFIRDTLGFPGVDAGDGWLIFRLPPAEIAVHPTDGEQKHELYLMCEDIASTLQELAAKGVEPTRPISDEGWGLLASVSLPSGSDLRLYQPRHPVAHHLGGCQRTPRFPRRTPRFSRPTHYSASSPARPAGYTSAHWSATSPCAHPHCSSRRCPRSMKRPGFDAPSALRPQLLLPR